MNKLHFSNWISLLGIVGGVTIALGFSLIILWYGEVLGSRMQSILVILALLIGGIVAAVSVVVGITIPTAITDGKLDLNRIPDCTSGSASIDPQDNSHTKLSGIES